MRSHEVQKLGRNDPCSCGSGKKFKRCCLMNHQQIPEDSAWRLQNEASLGLSNEIMKFARREFPDRSWEAWIDFNQVSIPPPMDKFPGEEQIFLPYFLYDWDPLSPRRGSVRNPKPGIVIQAFLSQKAHRLSDLQHLILAEAMMQPVSFYEVLRCDPGHGMRLRDVLLGSETEVEEHAGSETLQPGDLLYAQLCRLPDVTSLGRMAPIAIPPGRKGEVVKLRLFLRRKIAKKNRPLAAEDLIRYRDQIRCVYLDARDARYAPPKLANTDREPLVFHTLKFRVGSAQVAFDALASLARGASKEDLLESAEIDPDGALRAVEIPWVKKGNRMHKTWDNTILGHLKISGRSLTAEVNSAKRAERIRSEIETRLGMMVVHQETLARTPDEMMEQGKESRNGEFHATTSETEIDPDIAKEFQHQMQAEIESWVDSKVPALGGMTPRQAVADPDGREIVDGLLLQWERDNRKPVSPGVFRPDVGAIRKLLNL